MMMDNEHAVKGKLVINWEIEEEEFYHCFESMKIRMREKGWTGPLPDMSDYLARLIWHAVIPAKRVISEGAERQVNVDLSPGDETNFEVYTGPDELISDPIKAFWTPMERSNSASVVEESVEIIR